MWAGWPKWLADDGVVRQGWREGRPNGLPSLTPAEHGVVAVRSGHPAPSLRPPEDRTVIKAVDELPAFRPATRRQRSTNYIG